MTKPTPLHSSDLGPDLSHIDTWVFDLDNTLYPATCNLFSNVDRRISEFVAKKLSLPPAEARIIQKQWYLAHGTTLNGLMKEHAQDPEPFLDYVHDIDLTPLDGVPDIADALAGLPGKRFVFTNGSRKHAENILGRLKLDHLFSDLVDIKAANFTPKHLPGAFDRFVDITKSSPRSSVMFEDLARNLEPAHALGFTTVLVRSDKDWSHEPEGARPAGLGDAQPAHVHHVADDLGDFLRRAKVKP